jgi:hypothetical protein
MKKYLLITFTFLALTAVADEVRPTETAEDTLNKSFQREYVYMTSQKQALQKQKATMLQNFQERIGTAKAKTQALQKELVAQTSRNDEDHELLLSLDKRKKELQKKGSSLENTFKKANSSVKEFERGLRFEQQTKGTDIESPEDLKFEDFDKVINQAADLLTSATQVEAFPGSFLDLSGNLTEGTITRVGRVAAIGSTKEAHFVLGPDGEGLLKALEATESPTRASLNLYIFESLNKAAKIQREAGFSEKLADWSPLLFLGLILVLVAGLFGALIKV